MSKQTSRIEQTCALSSFYRHPIKPTFIELAFNRTGIPYPTVIPLNRHSWHSIQLALLPCIEQAPRAGRSKAGAKGRSVRLQRFVRGWVRASAKGSVRYDIAALFPLFQRPARGLHLLLRLLNQRRWEEGCHCHVASIAPRSDVLGSQWRRSRRSRRRVLEDAIAAS